MARIFLNFILPLALPFIAYALFVLLTRGRANADWQKVPWAALSVAAVVLLAVSLFTWDLMSGSPPGEVYVPPRFEDGRVVPATTVKP